MELTPELLALVLGTPKVPDLAQSCNVAPTQTVLVVRQTGEHRKELQ
jgi:putative SOS response-associated peptidase YedK